ncbi:MAG: O-antigen ligase family protein [Parvularculaceae bacterium]
MSISVAAPPPATALLRKAGWWLGFTVYVALAAATAVILPPLALVFLLPPLAVLWAKAPEARAAPRKLALALVLIASVLLAVWPVYIFVKVGPSPILTPPRLILYAVSAMWLYDMAVSRYRRAQFSLAVRRSRFIAWSVFGLFALGLLSLPLAEGRALAAPEFFRQTMIWLLPFCAVLTYCRREREFEAVVKAFIIGAMIVAGVAVIEAATQQLMAIVLSPFIGDDAVWLQNVQLQKIRDGFFRAQASHTHPLSLGEHMAFVAPFALAFTARSRDPRARWLWAAAFTLILLGAVATNSRGAGLGMTIALGFMAAVFTARFLTRPRALRFRPLVGLATAILLLSSPLIAAGTYAMVAGKGGVSASNSTQSRLEQMEQAWPKILKRPVLGYGSGRSSRILGFWGQTLTIDNYYLTLALDFGFPGPAAFIAMLVAFGLAGLRRAADASRAMTAIYLACAGAAAAILISRTITSQTGNLAMIFVLIAAFAGTKAASGVRRRASAKRSEASAG